jgi:hypothetical protein
VLGLIAECILADGQQIAFHDKAPLGADVIHLRQQLDAGRETAIGELDPLHEPAQRRLIALYGRSYLQLRQQVDEK